MPRSVCGLALILFIVLPAIAADDEPLDQLWHVRPGKNHYGSPGISGDRVWVAQMSGALYGLDPKTGEVMVSAQVDGKIYGGLTATDDGIYVAAGKAIHCIDPKTGKPKWRYDFGAPCSLEPAVDGDHVLACSRRSHVALLDAKTGREIWKRDVDFSPNRIALAGDVAILSAGGCQEEGLHLLDRKTGATRWKAPYSGKLDGLNCTGFAIGKGVVYYGDAALNLADGKPVWRLKHPARHFTTGPRAVVAVFGGGEVVGLDPETGADLWSWQAPGVRDTGRIQVREAPAVVNGTVVVAVEEGHVTLLSERTGRVIATKNLGFVRRDNNGTFQDSPAIHQGVLIAATSSGQTFGLVFPRVKASWRGAHGGPGQWGQAFEPDVTKLLNADPPANLSGLDAVKGQENLAQALVIEERSAKAEALIEVVKAFPDTTLAGYRARKLLASLLATMKISLSFRNLPDVPFGVRSPDGIAIMGEVLTAKPLDPDTVAGLYDLDDTDIAEGLISAYYGRRAWACRQVAKLPDGSGAQILIDRAMNDPSYLVRGVAVEGLRGNQSEASRALIRRVLSDESETVRRAACVVAISVLGEEGRKLLKKLALNDPEYFVRALAKEQAAK